MKQTPVERTQLVTIGLGRNRLGGDSGRVERIETVDVPPIIVKGRAYSRREIADAVGLHISTISKYFSGSRHPSTRSAFILASYFGVSMEFLWTKVLPFATVYDLNSAPVTSDLGNRKQVESVHPADIDKLSAEAV